MLWTDICFHNAGPLRGLKGCRHRCGPDVANEGLKWPPIRETRENKTLSQLKASAKWLASPSIDGTSDRRRRGPGDDRGDLSLTIDDAFI
ncbi:hypothetical protein EVAR_64949_1 [Eumeta japonica]|uniref:Uncharacterized protein n=1 Tax=Eumeta variegata TaxID=151549 RepID=A0A4C1ZC22_EUMVA|nr:hypothetical protein EVAR_64949_1 [Eumeta japonica]